MINELQEFKAFWKDLMQPVYEWLKLPEADEKWADGVMVFALGVLIVEIVIV